MKPVTLPWTQTRWHTSSLVCESTKRSGYQWKAFEILSRGDTIIKATRDDVFHFFLLFVVFHYLISLFCSRVIWNGITATSRVIRSVHILNAVTGSWRYAHGFRRDTHWKNMAVASEVKRKRKTSPTHPPTLKLQTKKQTKKEIPHMNPSWNCWKLTF